MARSFHDRQALQDFQPRFCTDTTCRSQDSTARVLCAEREAGMDTWLVRPWEDALLICGLHVSGQRRASKEKQAESLTPIGGACPVIWLTARLLLTALRCVLQTGLDQGFRLPVLVQASSNDLLEQNAAVFVVLTA